jgi:hypothetical protein
MSLTTTGGTFRGCPLEGAKGPARPRRNRKHDVSWKNKGAFPIECATPYHISTVQVYLGQETHRVCLHKGTHAIIYKAIGMGSHPIMPITIKENDKIL